MEKKEAVLRVKLDENLKKQFHAAAKNNDLNCSQVLRSLIRSYVKKNGQGDLF